MRAMKRVLDATLLPLFWTSLLNAEQQRTVERPCVASPGRVARAFQGEVRAGQLYERRLGRFVFRLRPDDNPNLPTSIGWHIRVFDGQRSDDLSQFTLPYRGPNDRDVFAWFDADGNLHNAPARERTFYFSPEVGRSIRWEDDGEKRRRNQQRIENYGRGDFDILEYRVGPAIRGVAAVPFTWIKFAGCLTWPEG